MPEKFGNPEGEALFGPEEGLEDELSKALDGATIEEGIPLEAGLVEEARKKISEFPEEKK